MVTWLLVLLLLAVSAALAYVLITWSPPRKTPPPPPPPPSPKPRRKTQFDEPFPHPETDAHDVPVLHAMSGPLQGQQVPIDKVEFRIGGDEQNELCLTGEYVSSLHASLLYDAGARSLSVRDESSRNGTLLNDEYLPPLSPRVVGLGDRITIGSSVFEVRVARRAAAAPPEPSADPRRVR